MLPKRRHVTGVLFFLAAFQVFSFFFVATSRNETFLHFVNLIATNVISNHENASWLHWAPRDLPQPIGPQVLGVRPLRFHERWSKIPAIKTLSLNESNHRVLYSSMSDKSGDGLGHSLATFNAEVSTAIHMGLTYTHRRATFSSLTDEDSAAVDDFFGWGYGEISRENIQRTVCEMDEEQIDGVYDLVGGQAGKKRHRVCAPCEKLRPLPHEGSLVDVAQIVQLPPVASFPTTLGCKEREYNYITCRDQLNAELLRKHPGNTLFTMTPQGCNTMAPNSKFEETAGWYYDHYWRRPWLQNRSLSFDPTELTIAIHARRGDFLSTSNSRKATPSTSFQAAVAELLKITQQVGGPFSRLPVAVHVYSEGTFKGKAGAGHNISKMDQVFVGTDGAPETAQQWQRELRKLLRELQPEIRVELHIAQDTLSSLHEMVSADIFIGSDSGMSTNIVKSLSRGVVILPGAVGKGEDAFRYARKRFGTSAYAMASGDIESGWFTQHWEAYVEDFRDERRDVY